MNLYDIIKKSRSYRRFYEDEKIDPETLKSLVNLARLSPSATNAQPLKFILSVTVEKNSKIFSNLAWAGYLKEWNGPKKGERPSAYIIILGDTEISQDFYCDHGIAAQSILLGAVEKDLGGCIIGSIKRMNLREELHIPLRYEILLVIALGKPKEKVVLESVTRDGDTKYWRDKNRVHHVPKRSLEELILDL
jgi:nitroreductase